MAVRLRSRHIPTKLEKELYRSGMESVIKISRELLRNIIYKAKRKVGDSSDIKV